jgi:hypothetical protein
MVGLPIYFDNRQFLVTTESMGNEQTIEQSYILPEVYNTRLDTSISPPSVENISKMNGSDLLLSGHGQADLKIVVNIGKGYQEEAGLKDNNVKIFIANTDKAGNWSLETDGKSFILQPGEYWLQAMAYNDKTGRISEASPTKYFEINQNLYDRIISKVDVYLNYFMIAFISLGIFSLIILI